MKLRIGFQKVWSIGAAYLIGSVFCAVASAQMGMSPIIIETRAYPGGLATFKVGVTNTGKQAMDCDVRVAGMNVLPGGLPVEADDAERSCKDWLTVEPTKFALKAGEGRELLCRLRVPKDAAGGYYAIISCQGVPNVGAAEAPGATGLAATMKLTHRGLVPILLNVPGAEVKALLDAAKPIAAAGPSGRGYTFNVPVRNRGNIHARLAGTIELRSDAGQLVERFDLEAGRGFILPMHERLFEGYVPLNLPDGVYLAAVRLGPRGQPPMQSVFPFYLKEGVPTVDDPTEELKAKLLKASAGFMVSPAQIDVTVGPGGNRTQAVELVNLTREAILVNVSLVEWLREPDGVDAVGTGEPLHGRSGRDWVLLGEKKVELRPLSRQRVPLTVALPKDATGERYAAVLFNREDVTLDASAHGQARRAAMLRVLAQGTGTQNAEIVDLRAERGPSGAFRFVGRVRNTGDLSIEPEARLAISTADGVPAGMPAPVTPPAIQAGAEGLMPIRWDQVLDPGEYSAVLSVQYADKKPALVRGTKFVVPQPGAADSRPATQPADALSRPGTQPATGPSLTTTKAAN